MSRLKNRWYTLPLLLVIGGVLYRIFFRAAAHQFTSQDADGVWSTDMQSLNTLLSIFSLIVFLAIIFLIWRLCSRKIVRVSAAILMGYQVIVLLLGQLSQKAGAPQGLFTLIYYLYLPSEMVTSLLFPVVQLFHQSFPQALWTMCLVCFPALFIPFAKGSKKIEGCEPSEDRTQV